MVLYCTHSYDESTRLVSKKYPTIRLLLKSPPTKVRVYYYYCIHIYRLKFLRLCGFHGSEQGHKNDSPHEILLGNRALPSRV